MPKASHKWARPANRPALEHGKFFFFLASFQSGDGFGDSVFTGRGDPGDRPGVIRVNHDAMFKGLRFHGCAKGHATFYFIADLYRGFILPALLATDGVETCAAADEGAHCCFD